MSNKFILIVFLTVCCSCKTLPEKVRGTMPGATNPGTCNIEGKILAVIEPSAKDSGTICAKYPCRAKVKIMHFFGCGAAVSLPIHGDDTIDVKFEYTLHSTEIFPGMKTYLPGLKKGDVFTAAAAQRLLIGTGGEFVVYDYSTK